MYPLQTVPLEKVPNQIIDGLDTIICRSVKSIIGIPTSTISAMLYAPRKNRGLGLINCKWELYLQHFSIAGKLSTVNDVLLHHSFDCSAEMMKCKEKLGVEGDKSKEL